MRPRPDGVSRGRLKHNPEGPREPPGTVNGVYIGVDAQNNASIELCSTAEYPYIDFSMPYLDYIARILGDPDTGNCEIRCSGTLLVNDQAVVRTNDARLSNARAPSAGSVSDFYHSGGALPKFHHGSGHGFGREGRDE